MGEPVMILPMTLLNAWDTISAIGGSRIDKEVVDAYLAADAGSVSLEALYESAGRKIAELTGVPSACVTGGASAGILMAVAACLTLGDERLFERLPEGDYPPVLMIQTQQNNYTPAVHWAGARLVEIDGTDMADASAFIYFSGKNFSVHGPSLRSCAECAHAAGIPVIVDAAAQLPPLENFTGYLKEGADIVLYSGGKAVGGPQSTGFALGDPVWIERIQRLTLTGRGLAALVQVGGMQIMGLLTALKRFVEGGCSKEMSLCEERCARMAQALEGLYTTKISRVTPLGQTWARLLLWHPKCNAVELKAKLNAQGVEITLEDEVLRVNPWGLYDSEEARLVALLKEEALSWA